MYRPFCAPVMSANRAWRTVAGLPPSTRRTAAHVYILRVAIACAPVALLNFNLPALKAAVLQLGSNLDKGLIVHANSSFYLHSDIFPRILPEFSQAVGVRVFTVVGRVESHSSTFVLDLGPLVFTALLLIACTAVCFRWRPTSRDTAPLRKKKGGGPNAHRGVGGAVQDGNFGCDQDRADHHLPRGRPVVGPVCRSTRRDHR